MIEHVIGIDPGLDGVGMAWLVRDAGAITVRETLTVRTAAGQPMGLRLRRLSLTVRDTIDVWLRIARETPDVPAHLTVAIEVPTNPGRSDQAKKAGRENVNARSMMGFWQALGVIREAVAASGAPSVDLPPGAAHKLARQDMFGRWTAAGRNADERDAIVIACVHLFSSASVADLARAMARTQ